MIFFLLIIFLYGSNIESQDMAVNLFYTLTDLTTDYPWLFDNATEQAMLGEKSITIEHCRLKNKYILWPAKELTQLHFCSISLEDPLDLHSIPLIKYLSFSALDHNPAAILKKNKFPPLVMELTFGEQAVRIIKFIEPENFVVRVECVKIHKETYNNFLDYEKNKIKANLNKLLQVDLDRIEMIEDSGFFVLHARRYTSGSLNEKKVLAEVGSISNLNLPLYNGEKIKKDYSWLYDTTVMPKMSDCRMDNGCERKIIVRDCKMESKSIVWPSIEIFMFHLDFVSLVDPFDLSSIPVIDYLTLQALDSNSAQILRECKFPQVIFELRFDEGAVRMINFIRPENFAVSVEYIKIYKPTVATLLTHERNKLFTKVCELLDIDEEVFMNTQMEEKNNFFHIDAQKYKPTVDNVPLIDKSQLGDWLQNELNPVHQKTIESAIPTLNGNVFRPIDTRRAELRNVDLRNNHDEHLTFFNYLISRTSIRWPTTPIRKLSFVDAIFLDPLDLLSIPFISQLSFHQIDQTAADILRESKLPKVVESLIFGEDSFKMIHVLQSDFFPGYVEYVFLDGKTFMAIAVEAQDFLLTNLCQLLTQSKVNGKFCAQRIKEEYFETIENGFFLVEATKLAPIDAKKVIYWEDKITSIENLSHADEINFVNMRLKSSSIIWPTTKIGIVSFQNVTFTESFDLSWIASVGTLSFFWVDHNPDDIFENSTFPRKVRSFILEEKSLSMVNALFPDNFATSVERVYIHEQSFQELNSKDKKVFVDNLIQLICNSSFQFLLEKEFFKVCTEKIQKSMYETKKEKLIFGKLIQIEFFE